MDASAVTAAAVDTCDPRLTVRVVDALSRSSAASPSIAADMDITPTTAGHPSSSHPTSHPTGWRSAVRREGNASHAVDTEEEAATEGDGTGKVGSWQHGLRGAHTQELPVKGHHHHIDITGAQGMARVSTNAPSTPLSETQSPHLTLSDTQQQEQQQQQQHAQNQEEERLPHLKSLVCPPSVHGDGDSPSRPGTQEKRGEDSERVPTLGSSRSNSLAQALESPPETWALRTGGAASEPCAAAAEADTDDGFGAFTHVAAAPGKAPPAASTTTPEAVSPSRHLCTAASTTDDTTAPTSTPARHASWWSEHLAQTAHLPSGSCRRPHMRGNTHDMPRAVRFSAAAPDVVDAPSAAFAWTREDFFTPLLDREVWDEAEEGDEAEEDSDDDDDDGAPSKLPAPLASLTSVVESAFARHVARAAGTTTWMGRSQGADPAIVAGGHDDALDGVTTRTPVGGDGGHRERREDDRAVVEDSTPTPTPAAPLIRRVQLSIRTAARGGGASAAAPQSLSLAPPPSSMSMSMSTTTTSTAAAAATATTAVHTGVSTTPAREEWPRKPMGSSPTVEPRSTAPPQGQQPHDRSSVDVSRAGYGSLGAASVELQRVARLAEAAAHADAVAVEALTALGLRRVRSPLLPRAHRAGKEREAGVGYREAGIPFQGGGMHADRYDPAAAAFLDERRAWEEVRRRDGRSTVGATSVTPNAAVLAGVGGLLSGLAAPVELPASESAPDTTAVVLGGAEGEGEGAMSPLVRHHTADALLTHALAALPFTRMRSTALLDPAMPLWAAVRLPPTTERPPAAPSSPGEGGEASPAEGLADGGGESAWARVEPTLSASMTRDSMLVLNGSVTAATLGGHSPLAKVSPASGEVRARPVITTEDVLMLVEEHRRLQNARGRRRGDSRGGSLADVLASVAGASPTSPGGSP